MEVFGTIVGLAPGVAIAFGPTAKVIGYLLCIGVCLFIAAMEISTLAGAL